MLRTSETRFDKNRLENNTKLVETLDTKENCNLDILRARRRLEWGGVAGILRRFTLVSATTHYEKEVSKDLSRSVSRSVSRPSHSLPRRRAPFSQCVLFSNECLPSLRSKDGRKGGRRAFSNRCCASTAGLLPVCC